LQQDSIHYFLQPFRFSPQKRKNHLCAGKPRLKKKPQAEDAVATGPFHENGVLNAPTVSVQRFRGGGGRLVFGLWATYSVAASHLHRDSALAGAMQHFVPITAAGQRWIHTSFPFNKPQSGFDLHLVSLHAGTFSSRTRPGFCRFHIC
jgi:hypothetical protein